MAPGASAVAMRWLLMGSGPRWWTGCPWWPRPGAGQLRGHGTARAAAAASRGGLGRRIEGDERGPRSGEQHRPARGSPRARRAARPGAGPASAAAGHRSFASRSARGSAPRDRARRGRPATRPRALATTAAAASVGRRQRVEGAEHRRRGHPERGRQQQHADAATGAAGSGASSLADAGHQRRGMPPTKNGTSAPRPRRRSAASRPASGRDPPGGSRRAAAPSRHPCCPPPARRPSGCAWRATNASPGRLGPVGMPRRCAAPRIARSTRLPSTGQSGSPVMVRSSRSPGLPRPSPRACRPGPGAGTPTPARGSRPGARPGDREPQVDLRRRPPRTQAPRARSAHRPAGGTERPDRRRQRQPLLHATASGDAGRRRCRTAASAAANRARPTAGS